MRSSRHSGTSYSLQWPPIKILAGRQLANALLSQALRYIIHNTSLPQRTRAQAQLELSQMHMYTRSTVINNRCIAGGKGRGVLRAFRMARVSVMDYFGTSADDRQYPFRMKALAGDIPGVKKASW